MARTLAIAALTSTLVGCGPAPTTEAPDRPTLVIEPSDTKLPTRSKRSRHTGRLCLVSHDDFGNLNARWRLVTRQRGIRGDEKAERTQDVWATLYSMEGGHVDLTLEGELEDAGIAFVGDGLELDTRVLTENIRFYSAAPIWLAGVLLVEPSRTLDVERADGERVMVGLNVGDDFVPARVTDRAPCASLGLEVGDFKTHELTELADSSSYEIVGDEPVPVFPDPKGGRSGLALALGAGTAISAGKRVGARRRVRIYRPRQFTVLGWVPDDRLTSVPGHGWGSSGGSGFGKPLRGGGAIFSNRRDYRCRARTALWVMIADHHERVGTIVPERQFYMRTTEPPRAGLQPIFIDDTTVQVTNGARFAVPTPELARCRVVP